MASSYRPAAKWATASPIVKTRAPHGSSGLNLVARSNASIAGSGRFRLTDTTPLAAQAWEEFGLSVKARAMMFAAVACSPAKTDKVQPAIQSASGSSVPASIAPLARRTASAISASETMPKRWALWCARQEPIIAAAGA